MNIRHRVGFVGAGQISAFHAEALRRVPGAELAGVYDVDNVRAREAADTLGTRAFPSFDALMGEDVDVVHVLTPPDAHADVAVAALEMGAHVLVEKPLATTVQDCRRIQGAAEARHRRVCVDHSLLYDLQVRRALDSVRNGAIGRLVSMQILRSAAYPPYKGGPLPPQYRSAGYPFWDLGVHQLYLLEAFLGPIQDVSACWCNAGGDPNLVFDEWSAIVSCRQGIGEFHISFNARPIQNTIVLQGTSGVLRLDQMSMYSTRRIAMPLPKTVERVLNAYSESLQTMVGVPQAVLGFMRKEIRQFHGLQELVREFYLALDEDRAVPVGIDAAIPIVEWTGRVARAAEEDAARARGAAPANAQVPILVTGAAGALGNALVARLCEEHRPLRVFVRRRGIDSIPNGLDVVTGDLADPDAVDTAVRGARVVIHAGAATAGSWAQQHTSTVVGTKNIIDACLRHGVEQLVYISSLSVVDWAGGRSGEPISESSPLEPRPELRGAYTQAKLEAENLVRRAVEERGLRAVILRPGQIFGRKLPLVNDAVVRRFFGRHIVLGDGHIRLPLVYIDDVVDGVCYALARKLIEGEIVQLVDDHPPTQNEILKVALQPSVTVIRVPRTVVFALGWLSEVAFAPLHRSSPLSRYRLRSALARRAYVSENAEHLLGWKPRVGVHAGMEATLSANGSVEPVRRAYAASKV